MPFCSIEILANRKILIILNFPPSVESLLIIYIVYHCTVSENYIGALKWEIIYPLWNCLFLQKFYTNIAFHVVITLPTLVKVNWLSCPFCLIFCFSFIYLFIVFFSVYSFNSYQSSNYFLKDSCRSFLLIKGKAKNVSLTHLRSRKSDNYQNLHGWKSEKTIKKRKQRRLRAIGKIICTFGVHWYYFR